MKTHKTATLTLALAAGLLPAIAPQDDGPIDAARLKEMFVNLGYEVKPLNEEAGKEKYEFTVKTDSFDIPIAGEISGSKNYVWLTVFLGDAPKSDQITNHNLLKRNFKIQPSQFYITDKGALMMAIAIDNRAITPAVMRRLITKVADDVVATADLWNTAGGGPLGASQ